jgi:hypothetical protein
LACGLIIVLFPPLVTGAVVWLDECKSLLLTLRTLAFDLSPFSLQSFKHPGSHWLYSTF